EAMVVHNTLPTSRDLVDLLRDRAAGPLASRGYTFLWGGDRESQPLTFRDLDRRARAIGYQLRDAGKTGERALLLFAPGLDFISAFFGGLYAGVMAVPAYPPTPPLERTLPRLKAIIEDARPSLVLTSSDIEPMVAAALQSDPLLREIRCTAVDT